MHVPDIATIRTCFVCKQELTGPFAVGLARKILDSTPATSSMYTFAIISHAAELFKLGLYAECERELRRAEQLGAPFATIESQLALCFAKTGRLVEAETMQRALHGETDIATTTQAHNLAATLTLMGRHAEAVDLFRLVYKTDTEQLGPLDSATLEAGAGLGESLLRMKAYREAVEVLGPVY